MNNQTLIIYKFTDLYQVLKEIEKELNYIIVEYLDEKTLKKEIKNIKNYLIVVKQKSAELDYQYVVQPFPITLTKLIEKLNIEILSSGGTYKYIKKCGFKCIEVSDFTNFKEILDGRVKTLHPKIHSGILFKR